MRKCPRCGNELERHDDGKFYCDHCNESFANKNNEPESTQPIEESHLNEVTQSRQAETAEETNVNDELQQLKERIAALEAEKQQNQNANTSIKAKLSNTLTNFTESKAFAWIKKHWIILIASILSLIVFITLMTCLVGIRGIYVNIDDPNDFYSFTATGYTGYSEELGETYIEKGAWKTSGGKITFTVKDKDLGKFSADFQYSVKDGYKTLFIGEVGGAKEDMKQYKRVSLVKYDINIKKANVTFDLNGGEGNISNQKIKIGEKIKEPSETPVRSEREFRGWYTEPYGFKNGGTRLDEDSRVWENVTYFANWYNPTEYVISLMGETSETVTAKEGDNLLNILQSKHNDCEFFYNDIAVDNTLLMPAHNIEIKCVFNDAYWKEIEEIYSFYQGKVSCRYTSISGDLVIPSNYRGERITSIGSFHNCIGLTSVVIPDSVTSIGLDAFCGCNGLTSVTIGNGVTSIGERAFYECIGLTSVTIGNSVTSIGYRAFGYCSGLTSVVIPDSVTSIDHYAFEECMGLTSVTIGNSVTSIGNNAFYGCDNLQYNEYDNALYLGNKTNPYMALIKAKSTRITSCNINSNTKIIADSAFDGCRGLTSVTIGNSVTSIGSEAFDECMGLTSVTIGNSVTSIGNSAFA